MVLQILSAASLPRSLLAPTEIQVAMEVTKTLIQRIEVPHEPGLTYTQLFLSVSRSWWSGAIQELIWCRMRIYPLSRRTNGNGHTSILLRCAYKYEELPTIYLTNTVSQLDRWQFQCQYVRIQYHNVCSQKLIHRICLAGWLYLQW